MPSGLKRYYGQHHLHFITSSCYDRRPYLTPARRDLFLQMLEEVRQKYRFVVLGYVIMPEHFHLLMSEPEISDPSFVIKAVKYRVSRKVLFECRNPHTSDESEGPHTSRSNAGATDTFSPRDVWGTQAGTTDTSSPRDVWGTSGWVTEITSPRFWHHRFYDFNVFTEKKRVEKLNYMHANPVERGLVFRPEDWPWSSYRWYTSGEEGPVKLNIGWPEIPPVVRKVR